MVVEELFSNTSLKKRKKEKEKKKGEISKISDIEGKAKS